MAPNLLCNTKNMSRERWLECRAHGPDGDIEYALGGSDVSVVFGENPWTTPLELYQIKKQLLQPDDDNNADQKEMGRLMEPIVAHWYGRRTGNGVIEDYGLYQHADHPYALANLDYRVHSADGDGILECKTTSWHKAGDWADGAVPHHYELQIRFYMAVMDVGFADIACMWGTNPESDMVIRRVNRDRDIEAMIFERLDEFIERLRTDTPPTMAGVDPKLAMAALARVYGDSQPGQPTIEFGKKHEKPLRLIAALQEEISDLDRRARDKAKEVTALIPYHGLRHTSATLCTLQCSPNEDATPYYAAVESFFLRGQKQGVFRIDFSVSFLFTIFKSGISGLIDAERKGRVAKVGIAEAFENFFLNGIRQ